MSIHSLLAIIQSHSSIIIILIFAGIPLLIGSAAATKSVSTVSDFFLCNRSLGTLSAFFTIYATWWSSFAFMGSTASFYSQGPVYWIALGWNVLFGLLFFLLGKKLWEDSHKHNYKTPIGFFKSFYKSSLLNNLVLIIMIVLSIPYIEVQLMGGGILIDMATGGALPWQMGTLIFLIIMIIYLWSGGLRAVVWADAFYTVLIMSGLLLIGGIFTYKVGGLSSMFETISKQSPESLKLPETINGINGYGFWISMLLIMPIGEIMMPQIWTRTYAIKSAKTFYIMPFLISVTAVVYVGTMLTGNAAIILEPDNLASSDYILPVLLLEYLPVPLMALLMCCAAAACLSTANSLFHSISHLITIDCYKSYINKNATEKRLVFVAKVVILLFAIISSLFLLFAPVTTIIATAYISFSGIMQLVVPVIGGLYWRKSTAKGAIAGLLIGCTISLTFFFIQPFVYCFSPSLIGLFFNALVFFIIGRIDWKSKLMKLEVSDEI